MMMRVEKVSLYVNSQEDAKKFWTEKMGFVVTNEQPMGPDATWLEVAPSEDPQLTSLVLFPKELMLKQMPEMAHHPSVIFNTDDPEALHQQLKGKGVEVTDINTMPYGKFFNFKDQDGNGYLVRG